MKKSPFSPKLYILLIGIILLMAFLAFFGISFVSDSIKNTSEPTDIFDDTSSSSNPASDTSANSDQPELPAPINFQDIIDQWVTETATTSAIDLAVLIYDLDNQTIVGSYQPDTVFYTASIYKLFFVYDGYRQIVTQNISAADPYVTTPDKDELTYGECLDLMIRESYNGCADPMRSDANAYARVEALITELGLANTSSAGLYSSATDLVTLLRYYWAHSDLDEASWNAILDSMLSQPVTTYDWRQGLPSGFTTAEVYDKVGWNWDPDGSYWTTYNDAAFVVFPAQNRHYAVVVLTAGLSSPTPIANLATQFENRVLGIE